MIQEMYENNGNDENKLSKVLNNKKTLISSSNPLNSIKQKQTLNENNKMLKSNENSNGNVPILPKSNSYMENSSKHNSKRMDSQEEIKIDDCYSEEENYEEYDDVQNENEETGYEEMNQSRFFKFGQLYQNNFPNLNLKCTYFESPINNSQIQYDCSAPIARNTPENNEVRLIEYRQNKIASFTVDGKELICLPQSFEIFLKNLVGGLHTVYTKLKRLDITPIVCNVEQVNISFY